MKHYRLHYYKVGDTDKQMIFADVLQIVLFLIAIIPLLISLVNAVDVEPRQHRQIKCHG